MFHERKRTIDVTQQTNKKPSQIKANGDLSKYVHQVSWQLGSDRMNKVLEPEPGSHMGILEKDRFYQSYAQDYENMQ